MIDRTIYRRAGLSAALALALFVGAAPSSARPGDAPRTDAAGKAPSAAEGNVGAEPNPLERFEAAQKLFDKGDYAGALDIFREVYGITKSPNARLMIGHCLLHLGREVEAYDALAATVIDAGKRAENEPKYAKTRDAAATEVARLELKVGKLVVALADPTASDVTMNGAPLAADRIGVPIAVEPGDIVVRAKRPGGGSAEAHASVRAGEIKTLTIVFKERPLSVEPSPVWAAAPSPAKANEGFLRRGGVRTLGFVAAGVGVLGMATFGVAGAMVESKLSSLESECGSSRCRDPKYASMIDEGKTLTAVTNIGLGVGIAGIAAGGLMIALGGAKEARSSGASALSSVSLAIAPGSAGAFLRGSF